MPLVLAGFGRSGIGGPVEASAIEDPVSSAAILAVASGVLRAWIFLNCLQNSSMERRAPEKGAGRAVQIRRHHRAFGWRGAVVVAAGQELTGRFPDVSAAAVPQLPPRCVVDGELVVFDPRRAAG
jgi:hypothetical protein